MLVLPFKLQPTLGFTIVGGGGVVPGVTTSTATGGAGAVTVGDLSRVLGAAKAVLADAAQATSTSAVLTNREVDT